MSRDSDDAAKDLLSVFNTRLREQRKLAGLTQQQLADRIGVPVSTIGRLESDPGANPTIKTVTALIEALGCTANDLLT